VEILYLDIKRPPLGFSISPHPLRGSPIGGPLIFFA
jgi:hypothetical protein